MRVATPNPLTAKKCDWFWQSILCFENIFRCIVRDECAKRCGLSLRPTSYFSFLTSNLYNYDLIASVSAYQMPLPPGIGCL